MADPPHPHPPLQENQHVSTVNFQVRFFTTSRFASAPESSTDSTNGLALAQKVHYVEYRSFSSPSPDTKVGKPGDVWIDLRPDFYALYARLQGRTWEKWTTASTPATLCPIQHPYIPNFVLWCTGHCVVWVRFENIRLRWKEQLETLLIAESNEEAKQASNMLRLMLAFEERTAHASPQHRNPPGSGDGAQSGRTSGEMQIDMLSSSSRPQTPSGALNNASSNQICDCAMEKMGLLKEVTRLRALSTTRRNRSQFRDIVMSITGDAFSEELMDIAKDDAIIRLTKDNDNLAEELQVTRSKLNDIEAAAESRVKTTEMELGAVNLRLKSVETSSSEANTRHAQELLSAQKKLEVVESSLNSLKQVSFESEQRLSNTISSLQADLEAATARLHSAEASVRLAQSTRSEAETKLAELLQQEAQRSTDISDFGPSQLFSANQADTRCNTESSQLGCGTTSKSDISDVDSALCADKSNFGAEAELLPSKTLPSHVPPRPHPIERSKTEDVVDNLQTNMTDVNPVQITPSSVPDDDLVVDNGDRVDVRFSTEASSICQESTLSTSRKRRSSNSADGNVRWHKISRRPDSDAVLQAREKEQEATSTPEQTTGRAARPGHKTPICQPDISAKQEPVDDDYSLRIFRLGLDHITKSYAIEAGKFYCLPCIIKRGRNVAVSNASKLTYTSFPATASLQVRASHLESEHPAYCEKLISLEQPETAPE